MKEPCSVCGCSLSEKESFQFDGDNICSSSECIQGYITKRPFIEPDKKKELVGKLLYHMFIESQRYFVD